jgi:alkanesulfonate monooxygenase SsuD/methylene tetrahydromethanopterin reductase-like flavin-dependent oxidoreductase (luciferase family)
MDLGVAIFPADFAIRPDDLAVAAEERGLESLFFTERTHVPRVAATLDLDPKYSHTFDLFVSLAVALHATSRLLVGSGVVLLPEHDPFNAAKAFASLDVLSGGRLLVGVPSQGDRLGHDLTADPRLETAHRHDVHVQAEQRLEVGLEAAQIEEGAAGLHLHQEVDVARVVGLAAGDGPEHPDVTRAVKGGDPHEVVPPAPDQLHGRHCPAPERDPHRTAPQ